MSLSSGPNVTVAGGGIAGITAALTLAQRGCKVTLHEAGARLGGCLSATEQRYNEHASADEVVVNYEVSPHMFGEWYNNFFQLAGLAGLSRGAQFKACPQVAFLKPDRPLDYAFLVNNGALDTDVANIFSGVAKASDMFLYYYTMLDILTQDFSHGPEQSLRNEQTLNGFIVTRPYATESVAKFFQEALVNIWAVDSFRTSIHAFQCAGKYQGKKPAPTSWTITDSNSYDLIITRLQQLLISHGVEIHCESTLIGVTVEDGKASRICVSRKGVPQPPMPVDNLVIAVPQHATGPLIVTSAEAAHDPAPRRLWKADEAEARATIAAAVPSLANVRSIEEAQLATLYIPFKRVFPGVPDCYVGLVGSNYSLTFIRSPYLERKLGAAMVLAVGISDFVAIPVDAEQLPVNAFLRADVAVAAPSEDPDKPRTIAEQEAISLVVTEFRRFIDFPDDDVIWDKVFLKTNSLEMLFLNTVGSRADAPDIRYDAIDNLYFAVGTKENPITIATVECAVYGGLQAAQALWARSPYSNHDTIKPVKPVLPETYDPLLLWAWKIAFAPLAVAAKCWSDAQTMYEDAAAGPGPGRDAAPSAQLAAFSVASDSLIQAAMASVTASFTFWAELGKLMAGGLPAAQAAWRRR